MSRDIDLSKSLSDDDRAYLQQRDRLADIQRADANAKYASQMSESKNGPLGANQGRDNPASMLGENTGDVGGGGGTPATESARTASDDTDTGSAPGPLTEDQLDEMTNDDLREVAGRLGVSKTGNKEDLKGRILGAQGEGEQSS